MRHKKSWKITRPPEVVLVPVPHEEYRQRVKEMAETLLDCFLAKAEEENKEKQEKNIQK